MDYIDTWGLYQCFQGSDDEMVVADCRKEFSLFYFVEDDGKRSERRYRDFDLKEVE